MKFVRLIALLGMLTSGVAQAQSGTVVNADYRAVPSLRHHLPLDVTEAAAFGDKQKHDIECLAWNLYFEIRGGTKPEQIAVAYVPINRLGHPEFSNDICTNVFQYSWSGGRRHFQFTWAGIVRGQHWKKEEDAWREMQRLAIAVYLRNVPDTGKGAIYFQWKHAQAWSSARKTLIGQHVFW